MLYWSRFYSVFASAGCFEREVKWGQLQSGTGHQKPGQSEYSGIHYVYNECHYSLICVLFYSLMYNFISTNFSFLFCSEYR